MGNIIPVEIVLAAHGCAKIEECSADMEVRSSTVSFYIKEKKRFYRILSSICDTYMLRMPSR